MSKYYLLSPGSSNTKTKKNSQDYLSAILHLAPSTLSKVINTCPAASKGCAQACLNTAGRGKFNNVQQARIRKTKLFVSDQYLFFRQLVADLNKLYFKALKLGKKPVVRLNGTSDIAWENIKALNGLTVMEMFPNIQFYDYTKLPMRLFNNKYSNYHLTFSRSEVNDKVVRVMLENGHNVAAVFAGKTLPEKYEVGNKTYMVVSGENSDLRFLDPTNVIVGLTAKGKAKKDSSGFVIKACK